MTNKTSLLNLYEVLKVYAFHKASWLSWLERRPVTAEVAGSSPAGVVCKISGIIAQLGEHLPYKQGVTGSSPVGPIFLLLYADVAQFMTIEE